MKVLLTICTQSNMHSLKSADQNIGLLHVKSPTRLENIFGPLILQLCNHFLDTLLYVMLEKCYLTFECGSTVCFTVHKIMRSLNKL